MIKNEQQFQDLFHDAVNAGTILDWQEDAMRRLWNSAWNLGYYSDDTVIIHERHFRPEMRK